jgi:hypothetical protein
MGKYKKLKHELKGIPFKERLSQSWHDIGHKANQVRLALARRASRILLGKLYNDQGMITRIPVECHMEKSSTAVILSVATVITEDISDLETWLQFHRKVGVQKFYIYSFVNLDVLRDSLELGEDIVLIPWARFFKPNSQVLSQAHAIANFGTYTEFIAFIDPDEYLVPKQGIDIKDVLNLFPQSNGFLVHWTCFNDNGLEIWPSGANLIETLTNEIDLSHANLQTKKEFTRQKHIVRASAVTQVGVHQCEIVGTNTNLDELVTLNHYLFKSKSDLDKKIEIRINETEPNFEFETWKRKRIEMHSYGRNNYVENLRAYEIWKY